MVYVGGGRGKRGECACVYECMSMEGGVIRGRHIKWKDPRMERNVYMCALSCV